MNTSEDEYDAYTFDEFTEQDFADIDSSILVRGSAGPSNQSTGGPKIIIEVEQPADNLPTKELSTRVSTSSLRELSSPKKNAKPQASPFQRHRSWNGILSVSDLVSPAWYETLLSEDAHSESLNQGVSSNLTMDFAKSATRNWINALRHSHQGRARRYPSKRRLLLRTIKLSNGERHVLLSTSLAYSLIGQ